MLGQGKTEAKSNETTTIPELLKLLEVKGVIVAIDAMGWQKALTADIIDRGGDYVLALKGNQDRLSEQVKQFFTQAKTNHFGGSLMSIMKPSILTPWGNRSKRSFYSGGCPVVPTSQESFWSVSLAFPTHISDIIPRSACWKI